MSASRFTWRTLVALAGLTVMGVGAQPAGAPAGTQPTDPASPTAPATTPITPAPPAAPSTAPAPAAAASGAASARPPVQNSTLDATLLYQLLVAEMELRGGEAG